MLDKILKDNHFNQKEVEEYLKTYSSQKEKSNKVLDLSNYKNKIKDLKEKQNKISDKIRILFSNHLKLEYQDIIKDFENVKNEKFSFEVFEKYFDVFKRSNDYERKIDKLFEELNTSWTVVEIFTSLKKELMLDLQIKLKYFYNDFNDFFYDFENNLKNKEKFEIYFLKKEEKKNQAFIDEDGNFFEMKDDKFEILELKSLKDLFVYFYFNENIENTKDFIKSKKKYFDNKIKNTK